MPNFFGDAHKPVKELLDSIKNNYNAEELNSSISNEEGKLKISKDDDMVIKFVSWVGEGGGTWGLTVEHDGIKTQKRRTDDAKSVSDDLEEYTPDYIIKFINKIIGKLI